MQTKLEFELTNTYSIKTIKLKPNNDCNHGKHRKSSSQLELKQIDTIDSNTVIFQYNIRRTTAGNNRLGQKQNTEKMKNRFRDDC